MSRGSHAKDAKTRRPEGSTGRTRQQVRRNRRVTGIVLAAIVLAAVGLIAWRFSSPGGTPSGNGGTTGSSTDTSNPPVRPTTCPLTGERAPGGVVPHRPAIAVKIDNWMSARPQSGLESADIVYDTMAEGGITRYIAVFQCKSSASIGPVRSLRWVDPRVLRSFGKVVLAFAGGIQPNLDTVNSSPWLCVSNAVQGPRAGVYTLNPDRQAPESTYTTTAALWRACPRWPPPPAQFSYSAAVPAGAKPAASARIPYTDYDAVQWVWSASHHAWLHYYDYAGLSPDYNAAGQQLQATNVVIEITTATIGPYPENGLPGSGDVQSNTLGGGTAYVLRDGKVIVGRWKRTSLASATRLFTPRGHTITLAPGNTWVEIVPRNLSGSVQSPPVTITP